MSTQILSTLPPKISVVIPLLNEADNLQELYSQLKAALEPIKKSYQIIFVDDGSIDSGFEILRQISLSDPSIQVIRFRRNFGQTAAMSAGFDHAEGEVIIPLDADLQNDPSDIGRLLEKLEEGYDIVSGWRAKRKDGFVLRRLPSILANWLIVTMTGVKLHDFGCTLKAYRREVIENINLYGELHRFIPVLGRQIGAKITEIKVTHHPRTKGQSKYGISRTIRVILDLIMIKFLMSYATRPIQSFGLIGLLSFLVGFVICGYLSIGKLFFPAGVSQGWLSYLFSQTSLVERLPMLVLGVLLLLTGIQLISVGLISELVIRTYYESQNKPIYVIKEILKFEDSE
ncbi:MAG: glycosyltransferase family 2 protein [Candidatus Poribacteria bacterium]|jgi:glycosyltransferase involved in cell wall biosynthesis|nr:glycosyltransferase family 2 protein [Candidatus Poribacteria bacterium]MDP6746922.1 glycosyltransferase family 2 protein [Candidatus Poribacteria bacterium]MDP6994819.1 glycosyltransferase family 2 protein [Candidatus Poribacteria bacterium]